MPLLLTNPGAHLHDAVEKGEMEEGTQTSLGPQAGGARVHASVARQRPMARTPEASGRTQRVAWWALVLAERGNTLSGWPTSKEEHPSVGDEQEHWMRSALPPQANTFCPGPNTLSPLTPEWGIHDESKTCDELSAIPTLAMSAQVASAYTGVPSEGPTTPHDPRGPPPHTPPPGPPPDTGEIPSKEGRHRVRRVDGGHNTKAVPYAPDVAGEAWVVVGAEWGVNHGVGVQGVGRSVSVSVRSVSVRVGRGNPRFRIRKRNDETKRTREN